MSSAKDSARDFRGFVDGAIKLPPHPEEPADALAAGVSKDGRERGARRRPQATVISTGQLKQEMSSLPRAI
jgi:hypothetical protein